MTSVLFKDFPVTLSTGMAGISTGNAPALDTLGQAGLLKKQGTTYELTELGRSAWNAEKSGFCYASGYEIKAVKDIAPLAPEKLGSAVEQGWTVAVDIGQQKVADWAKNPAIAELAGRKAKALSEAAQTYHVILGRVRGEQGLQVIDPRFAVDKGFGVNMAW